MLLERLHPPGRPIEVADMLATLNPVADAYAHRPYVIGSLVRSADGKGTLDGATAQLGDAADRAIFRGLRGVVDAILVGTGTLRDEKYGRAGRSETLRRIRASRNLAEEPTIMIVSRSLALPTDIPLLADPASQVHLYTSAGGEIPSMGANVQVTRLDPTELDLTTVLASARQQHGIRAVVCEGGPTLFGALVGQDLMDELFLTQSPFFVDGTERSVIGAAPISEPLTLELISVLRVRSRLFLRYARRHASAQAG